MIRLPAAAAGERRRAHARIVEDRLDELRPDEQRLELVVVEAGLAEHILDGEGALRDVGSVFEKTHVAGHQRGGGEAEDLPEWEVPRHHGQHRADRLVPHPALPRVRRDLLVGEEGGAVLGVEAAGEGTLGRLGHGGADRLAHLERHEAPELVPACLQQLGGAGQAPGTLGDGGVAVPLEGCPCTFDAFGESRLAECIEFGEDLTRGGIGAGDRHTASPLSVGRSEWPESPASSRASLRALHNI